MDALLAALTTKFSGSAFSTSVGGRIYLDQAPVGTAFPYCVFFIVTGSPDNTFREKLEDVMIQFSIFSTSQGAGEVSGIYNNLKTLLDEGALTVTGYSLMWMKWENVNTIIEELTSKTGTGTVHHWATDFSIKLLKA